MQCPKCGAELPEGAESCPACGEPATNEAADQTSSSKFSVARRKVVYGGFWLRAIAYLIDGMILGIALLPVVLPIIRSNNVGPTPKDMYEFYSAWTRQSIAMTMLIHLVDWLYSATLESSVWQATLGKKLLGLKVSDTQGKRLSFARASGRHFGKYLSSVFFLGFILTAFTEKKQALHDLIAGTLVVRNN